MKKLVVGLLIFVVALLVGIGTYQSIFSGKASSSLMVGQIDPAMVLLQDAVMRDPLRKHDAETGDSYRSWDTFGGRLNITVSKGEYTLLTVRNNQTQYLEVVELGMDGKVISGFGHPFDSRKAEKEFIIPSFAEAGKGEEYRKHYEQLAEKFKPIFFDYFGVYPTGGEKWGI